MKTLIIALAVSISSIAYASPEIIDPSNIVIDGQKFTSSEYIDQFCLKQYNGPSDPNCLRVMSETHAD